ncbi:MAG: DNA methyltransferase [Dehalococcoidia bacterium]|jgi:DNA modification methylase
MTEINDEIYIPEFEEHELSAELDVVDGGNALADPVWRHVRLKPNSMEFVTNPTYEEWERLGERLKYINGSVQFWIGDWVNYGENRYGDKYAQAIDATDYDYGTLANARYVAEKVEFSRRRENLPFSHHQEVASLPPEDQEMLLSKAEEEHLSLAALRELTRSYKRELAIQSIEPLKGVKPQLYRKDAIEWLRDMDDGVADLLLTDPPYMTDVSNIHEFAELWLPLALAKLKDSGQAYICIGAYPDELWAYLRAASMTQKRFTVENVLVWTYRNTLGVQPAESYIQNWQAILYLRGLDAPALNCPRAVEQFAVQDINAPDGRIGDRYHKWQKPDELADRFILHSTEPEALVIDPFAGSGTFLVRAAALKRVGVGCDIDEESLRIAEKRGCVIFGNSMAS